MQKPQPKHSVSLDAGDALQWLMAEGHLPRDPDPWDELMDYYEASNGMSKEVSRSGLQYISNPHVFQAVQAIFDHFIAPDFDGPVSLKFYW